MVQKIKISNLLGGLLGVLLETLLLLGNLLAITGGEILFLFFFQTIKMNRFQIKNSTIKLILESKFYKNKSFVKCFENKVSTLIWSSVSFMRLSRLCWTFSTSPDMISDGIRSSVLICGDGLVDELKDGPL